MRILFAVLLLALLPLAHAVTPPQFTVSWTAPVNNTDGSVISGAITYQMYAGVGPGKEVKLGTPVSSPPYVITPVAPGTNECVQVTAIVNGVESAKSAEACSTMPLPSPNSPTIITITIR